MNRFQPPPLLCFMLLTAGIAGAELWWWREVQARSSRALLRLEQARQERDHLARVSPAPSEENEEQLTRQIAALRERLEELRAGLTPRVASSLNDPAPERPMDAYFSLMALVEEARTQAGAARVMVRPDERFGFSLYAHQGPAAEFLKPVHRQQQAVQTLLEPLFEARPLALLGVKREAPEANAAGGEDFFTFDPARSVRQAGLVETEPLRIEFTGQTSTLRNLLNGLSTLSHPVVICSVEVEPLSTTGGAKESDDVSVPVVRQSLSKFTVVLEFVSLPAAPARPAS